MLRLYQKFPRQLATPTRKVVSSQEEMLEIVNKYNKLKVCRIWVSIYNYFSKEQNVNTIDVDKVFLDFDNDKTMFTDVCVMHDFCLKNNYRHIMFFSGRGFHFYLMTKNYENLKNIKEAISNTQQYFVKTLNLTPDPTCIGDYTQVAGFPNTLNTKRRRFCIPIDETDLANGYDFIREKALEQNFKFRWYGWELYDISKHDGQINGEIELVKLTADQRRAIDKNKILKELPKCLSRVLTKEHTGWRDRFLVVCYLRDTGYMRSEVIELLRDFLSSRDFKHCTQEERQVDYLFRRQEILFPNCDSLRHEGYCLFKQNCSESRRLYK